MRVRWSLRALDRVEEALTYAARERPVAASKWLDRLFERVALLRDNPEQGRSVPETPGEDFREILFGRHRIIYRVAKSEIVIATVRHQRQRLDATELED